MPAKSKPTITERIDAMASGKRAVRLCHLLVRLTVEFDEAEPLLTQPETIALAKKLLNRALKADYTNAEVEAFLRG